MVNFERLLFEKEPYVFASQARKVVYVEDPRYQNGILLSQLLLETFIMPILVLDNDDRLQCPIVTMLVVSTI